MANNKDERNISDFVWKKHKEKIRFGINLIIFGKLVEKEVILLTEKPAEIFSDRTLTDSAKKDILMDHVPKCKHDDYLKRFIACLRESASEAGTAHEELADLLDNEYSDTLENGIPAETDTATISVIIDRPAPSSGLVEGDAATSSESPKQRKCIEYLKTNRKWVVAYGSSSVWLLLGVIGAIIAASLPPMEPPRPREVIGQEDSIVQVDLGTHPFWLSSATLSIDSALEDCYGELYVIMDSCSTLPTTVQEFNRTTIRGAPFFLLQGSTFDSTLAENAENTVLLSYIQSQFIECIGTPISEEGICTEPNVICRNIEPGNSLPQFTVENSDYYTFCFSNGLNNRHNKFSLKWKRFNASTIREQYQPVMSISKESPWTLHFNQLFNFNTKEYCLLLDVDRSHCGTQKYTLEVDVHRRQDVLGLVLLVSLVAFCLHLLLVGCVHVCHYCRVRAHVHTKTQVSNEPTITQ